MSNLINNTNIIINVNNFLKLDFFIDLYFFLILNYYFFFLFLKKKVGKRDKYEDFYLKILFINKLVINYIKISRLYVYFFYKKICFIFFSDVKKFIYDLKLLNFFDFDFLLLNDNFYINRNLLKVKFKLEFWKRNIFWNFKDDFNLKYLKIFFFKFDFASGSFFFHKMFLFKDRKKSRKFLLYADLWNYNLNLFRKDLYFKNLRIQGLENKNIKNFLIALRTLEVISVRYFDFCFFKNLNKFNFINYFLLKNLKLKKFLCIFYLKNLKYLESFIFFKDLFTIYLDLLMVIDLKSFSLFLLKILYKNLFFFEKNLLCFKNYFFIPWLRFFFFNNLTFKNTYFFFDIFFNFYFLINIFLDFFYKPLFFEIKKILNIYNFIYIYFFLKKKKYKFNILKNNFIFVLSLIKLKKTFKIKLIKLKLKFSFFFKNFIIYFLNFLFFFKYKLNKNLKRLFKYNLINMYRKKNIYIIPNLLKKNQNKLQNAFIGLNLNLLNEDYKKRRLRKLGNFVFTNEKISFYINNKEKRFEEIYDD